MLLAFTFVETKFVFWCYKRNQINGLKSIKKNVVNKVINI